MPATSKHNSFRWNGNGSFLLFGVNSMTVRKAEFGMREGPVEISGISYGGEILYVVSPALAAKFFSFFEVTAQTRDQIMFGKQPEEAAPAYRRMLRSIHRFGTYTGDLNTYICNSRRETSGIAVPTIAAVILYALERRGVDFGPAGGHDRFLCDTIDFLNRQCSAYLIKIH